MKTHVIHHLILNSGRSQFSPLKDQSRHDLKLARMLIRCGGLQTPLNLRGFEFHLHQKDGWAHIEARSHDVLVLESFIHRGGQQWRCLLARMHGALSPFDLLWARAASSGHPREAGLQSLVCLALPSLIRVTQRR